MLKFSPSFATRRFHNSSISWIRDTRALAACTRCGNLSGWGQDCWLATCQDWWIGVSHGAKARLCHEHSVLAHCLAGRQTRLHQCSGSLVAASASATRFGNNAHCSRLNEDEVGTAESGYCKSACIEYQSAIRTSCGSVLLRHELNFSRAWWNATLPSLRWKSFAFYKVVRWHFSGVVGKG